MNLSKTQLGLTLLAQGKSMADAAKEAGVSPSTLSVARWKHKGKTLCPCCGQVVRAGFVVNTSVLK